jgi:hypothetical protein
MNTASAHDDDAQAQAQLEALRRNGGSLADPARFRYLEALARRVDAQPEPVRRLLQARLQAGVADYAARVSDEAACAPRRITRKPEASPLVLLNRALREGRPDAAGTPGDEELASARRFRTAWDAQRALEKLERALAHKPAQAGPLNSHALLLQSLELMRTLSPHYLRQFLLHAETLLWLAAAGEQSAEQPNARKKGAKAKPVRARQKK